jgi:prevent-host-death family protein
MRTLSIREMRNELGRLDQLISTEGEILITRRGKPIARLIPAGGTRKKPSHADLRAAMQKLATGSEILLQAERDER